MTLLSPTLLEPRGFRWTRDEFYRLFDQGMFTGRRVELIDGEIIEMPAQKDAHAWAIGATERQLRPIAEPANWIRTQMPLNLSQWSDPEPDLAIVPGSIASWKGKGHPTGALLVIEISDATLAFDRKTKLPIYAAAGIQEYWILNLVDRQLEVHRRPTPDPVNLRASKYGDVAVLGQHDRIAPIAFPAASILIAEMLA
jgi:Uma2 family endonuclease